MTFSSLVAVTVVFMLSMVTVANDILQLHSGQRTTLLSLLQIITLTAVQQLGQVYLQPTEEQTIYPRCAAG